jgi:hypothetical protein
MNFTTEFKHTLADSLKQKFDNKYNIINTEEIRYARGKHKIEFDIYLESGEYIVIIELEIKRQDPVHNIIKTVFWLRSLSKAKKVYMIQAFNASYYRHNKAVLKTFSEFIGRKAFMLSKQTSSFNYRSMEFDYPGGSKNSKKKLRTAFDQLFPKLVKRIKLIGQ